MQANNWARGYKTHLGGQAVELVPALDRLAVRQISPWYLPQDECIEIADLRRAGLTVRQIAATIGPAPSTVSRELRRNSQLDGSYRPFEAHRLAVVHPSTATCYYARQSCASYGRERLWRSGKNHRVSRAIRWLRSWPRLAVTTTVRLAGRRYEPDDDWLERTRR
ncbi:helix-turn-helix domain-containing protein [[Mycobacterium] burgundiense]|uniref:helix-turn-helix domain-containing protein n=1 Tax=[Mycobacterium] burgundiense TaxID=3064286 RepID=UPI003AA8407C